MRRHRAEHTATVRAVLAVGVAVALTLGVALTSGCGSSTTTTTTGSVATTAAPASTNTTVAAATTTTSGELKKLTLYLPLPVKTIAMFPAVVADALGYFKEEGLAVTIEPTDSSTLIVSQLSSGKGDAGLIVAGPAISAFAQGQDFKAVWEMLTHPVFQVSVPESSPVKSLADLKGKKIGVEEARIRPASPLPDDIWLMMNGLESAV
ncbi:MAG: ABC transporter substrate-binding protein [Actinobacteria bacterium]|nr:ABC transporter substrate-binding protein [Actinomycetota bacterium]